MAQITEVADPDTCYVKDLDMNILILSFLHSLILSFLHSSFLQIITSAIN